MSEEPASEGDEPVELEAEQIYLLMKKEYRISRNTRAQWYFNHLNQIVAMPKADKMEFFKGELEIISAVPQESPPDWDWDTSHLYLYLITPSTAVTFLSHTYRLALCLDLSPSAAAIDSVEGTIILDEILISFRRCVEGLARPFIVPGSQLLFCQKLYVTVIAHSPYLVSKGQQVLVAGWLLTQDNVKSFLDLVQTKLSEIEVQLSHWTNLVEEQRDAQLAEAEQIIGGLFESTEKSSSSQCSTSINMVNPEMSFVSMLRYGMLALELLPENSSAGIIIFTDGVFGTADAGMLEILLTQLRHNTIGCSFVHVGSRNCHPASSHGYLPNIDLMEFLSSTTFGAYISQAPEVDGGYDYNMNIYHHAFLTWGFHKSMDWSPQTERELSKWPLSNPCFAASSIQGVQKKESDYPVNCPLHSVLSCRLREGFTLKEVHLDEDAVEVRLALPWRPAIQVEYTIRGQWPITQGTVRCEISVTGPYDFLHDVTCRKQSLNSRYRQLVVQAYLAFLKNLSETDQLLAHIHSFASNPAFYTVPEGIKSGVPLFYMPPNETCLLNTSSDFAYPQFASFWKPVCVLDLGFWQRWLHNHRIGVLLQHDRPLPKHLHLPSTSGRYHAVQCRQAATALNAALRDFTTFALLENHSYIGLLYTDSDKPPLSFYLIRLTHKPPCVLIRIAFLGGTAGSIRHKIVQDLKNLIQGLTFPQRTLPHEALKGQAEVVPFCKVLQKSAEKILIRYEKMPADLAHVYPYDPSKNTNQNVQTKRHLSSPSSSGHMRNSGTQWSTLSHYLHHRRWIWSIQGSPGLALSLHSVSRILSIITKLRLQEGFSFAHSASGGIITMLLEVEMQGYNSRRTFNDATESKSDDDKTGKCAGIVQYVLFPPHSTTSCIKDSVSEDEANEEWDAQDADAQLEIVTECWIEPQAGLVCNSPHERRFFQGLDYHGLAESFYPLDLDCISSLVTFEHLSLMCQHPERPFERTNSSKCNGRSENMFKGCNRDEERDPLKDDIVTVVPFCFQLPRLLPKCSRAKLLFSTFVQEFHVPLQFGGPIAADSANDLLFELLTRQLSNLGHREVPLFEDECQQLLQSLSFQPVSDHLVNQKDDDDTNDVETETEVYATPRESNSTPRSPRDVSSSNLSSRPPLLTPLNTSHRSGVSSSGTSSLGKSRVPMFRCFVKGISSSHVVLVLLPASFQDLKLLSLSDQVLLSDNSAYVTKVAPDLRSEILDFFGEKGQNNVINDEGKHMTTTDGTSTLDEDHWSQSISQPCSLGPTRTNSLDVSANQRPRVGSSAARIRAGSFDTQPMVVGDQPSTHSATSCSRAKVAASNSTYLSSPFRPIAPAPVTSVRSSSLSNVSTYASITLPIYIFDCPLSSLIQELISRENRPRQDDLFKDHTFKVHELNPSRKDGPEESDSIDEPTNMDDPRTGSQATSDLMKDHSTPASDSQQVLSQYCSAIEALYCRALGQSLFTSLQQGQPIHSRDVQAAMDLCKETLLEVDITSFIQNICGHVKDFKMKSGLEILRQQHHHSNQVDVDRGQFPLSLLRLHQPCASLKHLHKLIRTRFEETLCLSFKPIPSQRDYYFYCTPDCQIVPEMLESPPDMRELHASSDEIDPMVEFCRSQHDLDDGSTDDSLKSKDSHSGPMADVEAECDDDEDDDDEDDEKEEAQIPLFLHLTVTIRYKNNKQVNYSQSINSLPTCLSHLISSWPECPTVLDLNAIKITLDFLCLTFRSELDEELAPATQNMRTTSFCSSSSGPPEASNTCHSNTSQELSEDEAMSMDEDDRTEMTGRQLMHIPESQRRPVKAAVAEIEWMLRDEIAAFLLDIFPITESMLHTVVEHVQSTPHRPSCRRRSVPLQFVLNSEESHRRFLIEFSKLTIQGHSLREEGSYYYLVENSTSKRFQGSLEPPLGTGVGCKNRHCSESHFSPNGMAGDTSVETGNDSINEEKMISPLDLGSALESTTMDPIEGDQEMVASEIPEIMMESSATLISPEEFTKEECSFVNGDSPMKIMAKKRYESGTASLPGRHSDSSSIVDSVRNTEDGYEGGCSDSEDECEWLKDLDLHRPKMPPFWLILKVSSEAVTSYFHCRYALARPEELLKRKQIHEDLLESIKALSKLINQQMLLKDLHDTRFCNNLLEPETNDDIWHQDEVPHVMNSSVFSRSSGRSTVETDFDRDTQQGYLEATCKFQPGTFACQQVWEAHFPLHPRLKTGPGKLGTSKGVQQLRFVLNSFSVNNRSNMFVYQEKSGNVFYLRLHESSCVGHKSLNDSLSASRLLPTDELDGVVFSSSRRPSQWNYPERISMDEDDSRGRSGSFSERESLGGDGTSLSSCPSLVRLSAQLRREDCILLKVCGVTEAGPAIKEDLVRVLQNKLDDAVLEVLHGLLSRNPACKLTADDVHFIQKPGDPPRTVVQFTIQTTALPYLPAVAYYLRQNLLDFVLIPKYMDACSEHHFQDYSANPVTSSDIYLYNRPQASGNRGIACIAFALVDGKGNAVGNLNWPRPMAVFNNPAPESPASSKNYPEPPRLEELEEFIQTKRYVKDPNCKRPGPVALLEFRIWERGHANLDALTSKLEAAISHSLWDVVLEYRLLPFPLCTVPSSSGEGNMGLQSLPCSEPTTPVRSNVAIEEEISTDPRSRSVSFSGLPPHRSSSSNVNNNSGSQSASDGKWKLRHVSGTPLRTERPLSPLSVVQIQVSGPTSPIERACERSLSTSSVASTTAVGHPLELDKFELGDRGVLHPVHSELLEKWFCVGLNAPRSVPSIKLHTADVLAPLTVPLVMKAFTSNVIPDISVKIFSNCSDLNDSHYYPFIPSSLCRKQTNPERKILNTSYILIGRNFSQWKESLSGEISLLENSQLALKMQRNTQRFVSYVQDGGQSSGHVPGLETRTGSFNEIEKTGEPYSVSPLIPRQRLLWIVVRQKQWRMYMYNFNKDNHESLSKQCTALIQWHNARWALLGSIVAQKLGLFHNQQCSMRPWSHETLKNNPYLANVGELDSLVKLQVPPPRDYGGPIGNRKPLTLPHTSHLETFRDCKPTRLLSHASYGQQWDLVFRHGQQWMEKRYSERREEMQRLLVLWQLRSTGSNISVTEDVIHLFKQVARTIHYCFTPLLFLPKWRMQVARTRDPNMANISHCLSDNAKSRHTSGNSLQSGGRCSPTGSPPRLPRRPTDDHWHQSLCSTYLNEYVQYLHTLGFVQLEIKIVTAKRGPRSALKHRPDLGTEERVRRVSQPSAKPQSSLTSSINSTSHVETNVLYFHKSHQGGILVCEVGVMEPFFYTKVYALEACRFLQSSSGGHHPNLAHIASAQAHYTDRFLNECDHIKVLLHLHSFTYDFHLRSLSAFVSGRQLLLKPGFHLVSFLDDFTKYYNKAPNFARNQVVTSSVLLGDPATPGELLFNYLLNNERRYGFQVLRMISSNPDSEDIITEYVLAKQWQLRSMNRDFSDAKQSDDYDVTLLVTHESPGAAEENSLSLKYYVILSSKREYYPRLFIEKKPGKFRTVSTATLVKAASAPPPETGGGSDVESSLTSSSVSNPIKSDVEKSGMESSVRAVDDGKPAKPIDLPPPAHVSGHKHSAAEVLSASNPELSFFQRKDSRHLGHASAICLAAVPEENRNPQSAAAAAAVAAVKNPTMRSPMFIRQEVVNYLGYFTKHEQDMQSMISEQAKKAEELIRSIVKQATVHCRRDTLWQRLQQNPSVHPTSSLSYSEFQELVSLSHKEPVSSSEPQLVPLLAQPVAWYQGLAKLLLVRYPETQRHFSSPDGTVQHVVILSQRLPATAMMLSWDLHTDKAELSGLCREMPTSTENHESSVTLATMESPLTGRQIAMQAFVEEFVNLCCFHMWMGLLG